MSGPGLLYIVSRGHSGSTLLELLLNRSQHIAAMGEIDLLPLQLFRKEQTRWVGLCSCGQRPEDCPVWGQVLRDLSSRYGTIVQEPLAFSVSDIGIEEETKAFLPTLTYKIKRMIRWGLAFSPLHQRGVFGPYRKWVERRENITRSFAKVLPAKWLVDASKDPLQMIDLATYSALPVKVIFLSRDVRGVAWSAIKTGRATAKAESRSWAALNGRILRLLERLDTSSYMNLHYEDLCSDPDLTLRRIHDFLGIECDLLAPPDEMSKRHTIAGNKVRFAMLDSVREDTAWARNLTESDLNAIRQGAGQIARELGYSL